MLNGGEAQRRIAIFSILNSAFTSRLLQQNDIHREVVAITTHPDAAAEGTEGIAVVFTSVLF